MLSPRIFFCYGLRIEVQLVVVYENEMRTLQMELWRKHVSLSIESNKQQHYEAQCNIYKCTCWFSLRLSRFLSRCWPLLSSAINAEVM